MGDYIESSHESRDVYSEVGYMTNLSAVIYGLVTLRKLAMEGNVNNSDILQFPITLQKVSKFAAENEQALRDRMGEKFVGMQNSVTTMKQFMKSMVKKRGGSVLVDIRKNVSSGDGEGVVALGDDTSQHQTVYGVVVDSVHRRVVVVFRGTAEIKDLIADLTFHMIKYDNPFEDFPAKKKHKLAVHCGFYSYLFETHTVKTVETNAMDGTEKVTTSTFTIFDKIFSSVIYHLKRNPGYKLFVTGHSMGGALATLFSFHVAAKRNEFVQDPVTCISVASPKVGETRFRKTFEWAEETGKLRHVRIFNKLDVVPMIPELPDLEMWASCCFLLVHHPAGRYRHTGVQIGLKSNELEIYYPMLRNGLPRICRDLFGCTSKVLCLAGSVITTPFTGQITREHAAFLYAARIEKFSEELRNYTIDDLYELRYSKERLVFKKKGDVEGNK